MDNLVYITAIEYEEFQLLKKKQKEWNEVVSSLHSKIEILTKQLNCLTSNMYGQKSERITDLPPKSELLPGLELPELSNDCEILKKEIEAKPATIKKIIRKKKKTGLIFPDNLEVIEEIIDVPESERTLDDGTKLVQIKTEISDKLAYRPSQYYIKRFIRPVYANPKDKSFGVVQEPMPSKIIDGSKYDTSFMANLIIEKCVFHMPLYRIAEKLTHHGIQAPRQDLCYLMKTCGQRLRPIYDLMTQKLLEQKTIFTDDTPVKLQQKKKCKKARMWIYMGGEPNAPPYTIYQFTTTRKHKHPIQFLKNYNGIFHADAYQAYVKMDKKKHGTWSACWAHARRKFIPATKKTKNDPATKIIRKIRHLFMLERLAWNPNTTPEQRQTLRTQHSRPIVDQIYNYFDEITSKHPLTPKSSLAKAIAYMQNYKSNFYLYLTNPNLRMDNNHAERGIRKLTIGRKNWIFIGSPDAGKSMAILISIIQTCRTMNINPQTYLEYLFNHLLDHPAHQLEQLLPDQWLKNHPDHYSNTTQK